MTYQNVLPFDENYAWTHLVQNLKKLSQAEKIVFYGLKDRKVTIRKISKEKYLITSYSMQALRFNIELEGNLRFIEVEFMSTMLKGVNKHLHIYEKSATRHIDYKKQIYRCKDPHCHHYTMAQFIEGKEVQCFKCQLSMIVPKNQLWSRNKHIVCIDCSKSPKKKVLQESREVFADIMNQITGEDKDPILEILNKEIKDDNSSR